MTVVLALRVVNNRNLIARAFTVFIPLKTQKAFKCSDSNDTHPVVYFMV